MQVKNFEDLEIWKDARALARAIYQLTRSPKFSKDFRLRDQIQRATVSIMSESPKDSNAAIKSSFSFSMSPKPLAAKSRSQIYGALDQSYFEQKDCEKLTTSSDACRS